MRLVIVSDEEKKNVLEKCHKNAAGTHHGISRTLTLVESNYYWTSVTNDVKQWVWPHSYRILYVVCYKCLVILWTLIQQVSGLFREEEMWACSHTTTGCLCNAWCFFTFTTFYSFSTGLHTTMLWWGAIISFGWQGTSSPWEISCARTLTYLRMQCAITRICGQSSCQQIRTWKWCLCFTIRHVQEIVKQIKSWESSFSFTQRYRGRNP